MCNKSIIEKHGDGSLSGTFACAFKCWNSSKLDKFYEYKISSTYFCGALVNICVQWQSQV